MTPRSRVALFVLIVLLALAPVAGSAATSERAWSRVSRWTTVQDSRISEASGISRSTYHRGLVFLHNDSGDRARFFAVGSNGRTRAVFHVRNVVAGDWEDMAAGPDHTLWFGDIGDNALRRDSIAVVRVREPLEMQDGGVRGKVFRLRYPDGPHNAEALMVRPGSGRVYVVTKATPRGRIYRAPRHLSARRINVLHRVGRAPATVTGADFAPGGRHFVLRTYSDAFLYSRVGGRSRLVSLPSQRQGEAIGFTRRGTALKIASEGTYQPIWRVAR